MLDLYEDIQVLMQNSKEEMIVVLSNPTPIVFPDRTGANMAPRHTSLETTGVEKSA